MGGDLGALEHGLPLAISHPYVHAYLYLMVLAVNRSKKMIIHAFRLKTQTSDIYDSRPSPNFFVQLSLFFVVRPPFGFFMIQRLHDDDHLVVYIYDLVADFKSQIKYQYYKYY